MRDSDEFVLAQLGQELAHDLTRMRLTPAALFEVVDLHQQTLAQVARADADGVLGLQHAQHRPHPIDVGIQRKRNVLDPRGQVALVVQ